MRGSAPSGGGGRAEGRFSCDTASDHALPAGRASAGARAREEPAGAEAGTRPRHPLPAATPGATRVRTRRSGPKRGCGTAARGQRPGSVPRGRGRGEVSPRGLACPQWPRYRAEPRDPHLPPAGTGPGAGRGCGHRLSPPRPQPRTIARRPDRGVANRGPALIHPPPAVVGRGGLLAGPAPRAHWGRPPAERQGGRFPAALLSAPSCARRSPQCGAPPRPSNARLPAPRSARASAHPLPPPRRRGAAYRGRAGKAPGDEEEGSGGAGGGRGRGPIKGSAPGPAPQCSERRSAGLAGNAAYPGLRRAGPRPCLCPSLWCGVLCGLGWG